MRIAIDGRMGHTRVGVGVYVRGLISSLGKTDKENEYFIIVNRNRKEDFIPMQNNFHKIDSSVTYSDYLKRDLWEQLYLPLKLHRHKIDVYHGPNYVLPYFTNIKTVLTMYDMISFLPDNWYKPLARARVQKLITISSKKANKIITGSENSKRDIIKILGVPEKKVRVIYIGIDDMYKSINNRHRMDSVKTRYNIAGRFILHVGSLNPRKNIPRLIEAYSRLPQDILREYQLVIAGKRSWGADEIFTKVKQLRLEDKVVFTGFVEDNDLHLLMSAASLLVFSSLYEGFGIPPLEAMACGVPVVASNTSSIPEVVGDAALLLNPYNVEEIADAMYRALTDEQLRNELRQKGFERVNQFSWEKAAKETLVVYNEVYNNKEWRG